MYVYYMLRVYVYLFTTCFFLEHSPISMAFFYPILVRSTPLRTIARVMRGEVQITRT